MSVLSIIPPIGIWKMEETAEEMWSLLQHKIWYQPEFSRLKAEQRQKEWLATRLLLKEMLGHEAIIHHHPSGTPYLSPDFVIVSPKNLHQRVWRFSDVLPSALFGCKPPCSEVV